MCVFLFPADMSEGTVGSMVELGITESFQVKRQVLLSASEAAEMILRVDNIIKAAPRSVKHELNTKFQQNAALRKIILGSSIMYL